MSYRHDRLPNGRRRLPVLRVERRVVFLHFNTPYFERRYRLKTKFRKKKRQYTRTQYINNTERVTGDDHRFSSDLHRLYRNCGSPRSVTHRCHPARYCINGPSCTRNYVFLKRLAPFPTVQDLLREHVWKFKQITRNIIVCKRV